MLRFRRRDRNRRTRRREFVGAIRIKGEDCCSPLKNLAGVGPGILAVRAVELAQTASDGCPGGGRPLLGEH